MATGTTPKITIRPLEDRVLIKPDKPEDKTKHGIYLPEGAKEKPMSGKVIAAGPGKLGDDGTRAAVCVKKGNTVVYGKYSGTEIDFEGESLVIVRESDLLGVLEK